MPAPVLDGPLTAVVGGHIGFERVLAALALVALAAAVSRWQQAALEREIAVAVLRSFVQLTAIGFVIHLIFGSRSLLFVAALLCVMVAFGALTARRRARALPGVLPDLLLALAVSAASTLGAALALGIFPSEARALVPVGGMVVGNAMTAAAVALDRLAAEVTAQRARLEARLALGASATVALRPAVRAALRAGMIPLVDSTKTTGLIFFPGTMVGMLVAGAEPLDAVRLQLILLYLVLGAVATSSLLALVLVRRRLVEPGERIRELAARPSAPSVR